MRNFRSIVALAVALAGALALSVLVAVPAAAQVTPQALAKLEARHQSRPNDAGAARALGIAYYKLKRFDEAGRVLAQAQARSPKDGVIALYLGLSAEERGDLTAARAAYTSYLSYGRTKSARNDVTKRLAAVAQKELAANAKARVADEQRLASQPGDSRTIAVLPLNVNSTNPDLVPLGRGLADLMISDFGKVEGLTLLERDRVQALLDEIALGQTNRVDNQTAARSGRLLQAGQIVTGSLTVTNQSNVQLNSSVVSVATGVSQVGGTGQGTLDQLFTFEKAVVLQTVRALGITLTVAQARAIDGNRPTQNVQAFVAYSRGLAASDAGRLDEAAGFFDNARALDPNFAGALQRGNEARAAQAGQTVTTTQIESNLRGSAEGQIVSAAERGTTGTRGDGLGSTLQNTLSDVNPSAADAIGRAASTTASSRDATSSTTSTDAATTKTGTVTIVIKRP